MSISFDWEFEEEKADTRRSDPGPDRSRRRRWLLAALVFLTIAGAVGLGVRAWINQRLERVKKTEATLQRLVELELKTIADGDRELFRSRQDPSDPNWQARQLARYITNPDVFVPAPGLTRTDRPAEIQDVYVVGRKARVELTQAFQSDIPEVAPLLFHVTWFYEQADDGNWYHVAPPDDYWGAAYSWHATRLEIFATGAEAVALDPLADDLAQLVTDACRLLDCPRGTRYQLRFNGWIGPRVSGEQWSLPPLYLAGLPENDAAHDAWAHALKLWVVEALAESQVGSARVEERVLYRQLLTRLQSELGLVTLAEPDTDMLVEAVLAGRFLDMQALWDAAVDADDPLNHALLQAEADALLLIIERRVGTDRLFQLFPALQRYDRLEQALAALYNLDFQDVQEDWWIYLFELVEADVSASDADISSGGPLLLTLLEPPPSSPVLTVPPGDQLAMICDGRVWVGNADDSNLLPITPTGFRFGTLRRSPDGRRLLTDDPSVNAW